MNLQHKHAGVILAAGASSRMGRPKALLPGPGDKPLAMVQAELLRAAGVSDVILVLGHQADLIAPSFEGQGIRVAFNPAWEAGRLSSLQAGLQAASEMQGVLILPVDSVGIEMTTLAGLLGAADGSSLLALRPRYRGIPGRVLWISHRLFDEVLGLTSSPDFRVDEWMRGHESALDVSDPAILNNINTPDEWERYRIRHCVPGSP